MLKVPSTHESRATFRLKESPLPEFDDMPEASKKGKWHDIANQMMFDDSELSDFNLCLKEGLNKMDVAMAIQYTLISFNLRLHHKIAGVAYMLSEWCEPIRKGQ